MAIGERIRFFRNMRGMTQKYLGVLMGFPEKSADIRMAQYESGSRTPKEDLTKSLAQALEVSPSALNVPDIDSYIGLMHTLFALEDLYGLKIGEVQGEVCLRADVFHGSSAVELNRMLRSWNDVASKLKSGEITQEEYNAWRYQYPKYDQAGGWTKTSFEQ
ncbi:MAG: helix-turn-helix transcriptional regulator [Oscillospiraceae bacterium]|jgi:transcriptional regulator with XRE-family HTH domain